MPFGDLPQPDHWMRLPRSVPLKSGGPMLRLVETDRRGLLDGAAASHRQGQAQRLIGGQSPPLADVSPTRQTEKSASQTRAERRVADSNTAAAGLSPMDARWVLAVKASLGIEGGRAAILRPEKRRELLALAERVGLRSFDANLVLAVVQDAARRGEDPLGANASASLQSIGPAGARSSAGAALEPSDLRRLLVGLGLAVLGAVVLTVIAARWITG